MDKYNEIKNRYSQGFITDAQLERYFNLNVITQEQYDEIYAIKHPVVEVTVEETVEEVEEQPAE